MKALQRLFGISLLAVLVPSTIVIVRAFSFVIEALSFGSPQSGTVIIDGLAVPDIRPFPISGEMNRANPKDVAKAALGKQLFFDGRLSKNQAISCAFCHNPATGWADPRQTSIGIGGGLGGRQAPTILNTAFNSFQFWDGRAKSLEEQVLGPIQSPIEMGETHGNLIRKLNGIEGYQQQFQAVFATNATLEGVGEAIAAFERTIISTNSAFDRYMLGQSQAMGASAVRGMALFRGKARCIVCHNGSNFTDNQFHNLGVPQVGPTKEDLGRYYVTKAEKDKGAFKTPTLRSVMETAPYMHDGVFKTIEEVVDFLNKGGGQNPNLSPRMKVLNLTPEEKTDLLAFLKALTGEAITIDLPTLPD
jgi:cytochrome c peroxidase